MEPTPNVALRMAIAADGRTQRAIARAAKIPETRFSAIARGRLNPNSKEQARIAKALNTTVDHLFSSPDRALAS